MRSFGLAGGFGFWFLLFGFYLFHHLPLASYLSQRTPRLTGAVGQAPFREEKFVLYTFENKK
jgi:hypothetical protein